MKTYAVERSITLHFIPMLRRRMLLDDKTEIPVLVDKTNLKSFGGSLGIEEYRNGWDQNGGSLREEAFYVLDRIIHIAH
jgi:hypothetical protein